jgi:hypothetical protein
MRSLRIPRYPANRRFDVSLCLRVINFRKNPYSALALGYEAYNVYLPIKNRYNIN